ncbi:MAG: hypothetical protein Q7S66_04180 [bacterium]|nr:hypothetical protein [bacterium]
MKEQTCQACGTVNALEFTLRAGNTEHITIRCKTCKKLLEVDCVAA